VEVTKEAGRIFPKIAGSVSKVNQIIRSVNAAPKEQSKGLERINTAVSQLDHVSQANAEESVTP
jgi:methyl-accepting chemotaxis protein